jgi:undecaprenyl-diphosphatase
MLLAVSLLGPIEDLDWRIQHAVQAMTPSPLDRPMHIVTDLGKPPIVLGVLLGIAVFGGPVGAATARHAVLALVPANLAVEGLKWATNRTRPDGAHSRSNASFPSSHAANAFALAYVFARRWPRASIAFYALAALVGFSRVYLNRHFTSDVLFAALIGIAAGALAERIAAPVSTNALQEEEKATEVT